MTLDEMSNRANANATAKGWWDGVDDPVPLIPEKLCLIHSEVSEALESYRRAEPYFWMNDTKPEGIATELADVVIRIGDLCSMLGISLEDAVTAKMAYNETRPNRHGGKVC